VRNRKFERGGLLQFKIHILFSGDKSWTFVKKIKFSELNIVEISTSFIRIVVLFDKTFKYGDRAKLWGYVGKNAKHLCLEFCNFVYCNILVNYLLSC
jgi:hypothetical protein